MNLVPPNNGSPTTQPMGARHLYSKSAALPSTVDGLVEVDKISFPVDIVSVAPHFLPNPKQQKVSQPITLDIFSKPTNRSDQLRLDIANCALRHQTMVIANQVSAHPPTKATTVATLPSTDGTGYTAKQSLSSKRKLLHSFSFDSQSAELTDANGLSGAQRCALTTKVKTLLEDYYSVENPENTNTVFKRALEEYHEQNKEMPIVLRGLAEGKTAVLVCVSSHAVFG